MFGGERVSKYCKGGGNAKKKFVRGKHGEGGAGKECKSLQERQKAPLSRVPGDKTLK